MFKKVNEKKRNLDFIIKFINNYKNISLFNLYINYRYEIKTIKQQLI